MTKLPKLKIKGLGWDTSEEIRDFDQAKHLPFGHDVTIVVEDQVVKSYEELVQLVASHHYEDKEFLEVTFLPIIAGG